jgi:predicted transglutaminase-like cysteine proteinase
MQWMQKNYGPPGVTRLNQWRDLINDNKNQPELFKLRLVTDFFAQVPFKPDQEIWNTANYWATPLEFLGKNAGDCEDFAIAKYITLRAMNVPSSKLRIVYVVSKYLSQAHMVLAYYETANANPLILDNLTDKILYASERPDLKPVYMFSEDDVWMTNNSTAPKQLVSGSKIAAWVEVMNRLKAEGLTEGSFQ